MRKNKTIKAWAVVGPKNAMENIGGIYMWWNHEEVKQVEIYPSKADAEKILKTWKQNVSKKCKVVECRITL